MNLLSHTGKHDTRVIAFIWLFQIGHNFSFFHLISFFFVFITAAVRINSWLMTLARRRCCGVSCALAGLQQQHWDIALTWFYVLEVLLLASLALCSKKNTTLNNMFIVSQKMKTQSPSVTERTLSTCIVSWQFSRFCCKTSLVGLTICAAIFEDLLTLPSSGEITWPACYSLYQKHICRICRVYYMTPWYWAECYCLVIIARL